MEGFHVTKTTYKAGSRPQTITKALTIYDQLKKDNLSDIEIKNVAQILSAFTINDKHWP